MAPEPPAEGPAEPALRRPGLVAGLTSPLRGGAFLLRHPRLLIYALVPLAVNVVLWLAFFYLSLAYFTRWLEALVPSGEGWYWVALGYLLVVLVAGGLLVLLYFGFVLTANLLAAPFNDALSARTEVLARGRAEAAVSLGAVLRETARTLLETVKLLGLYAVVMVLVLLFNLVPVAGTALASVVGALVTFLWVALGFLDYSLARHGFRLGGKLKLVGRNFPAVLGFGVGVFLGLLVPLLNLAVLPLAVTGGTLLYLELIPE